MHVEVAVRKISVGNVIIKIAPDGRAACCFKVIVYEFNAEFCSDDLVTWVIMNEAGVCI